MRSQRGLSHELRASSFEPLRVCGDLLGLERVDIEVVCHPEGLGPGVQMGTKAVTATAIGVSQSHGTSGQVTNRTSPKVSRNEPMAKPVLKITGTHPVTRLSLEPMTAGRAMRP
jgi:hypothetical protein